MCTDALLAGGGTSVLKSGGAGAFGVGVAPDAGGLGFRVYGFVQCIWVQGFGVAPAAGGGTELKHACRH